MKKLILLVLLFAVIHASAQKILKDDTFSSRSSYVTFNMFAPASPSNPRFRLGYIKTLSPKWKLGIDLGYGNESLSFLSIDDNIEDNYHLFEIRPEVYFILNPTRKINHYLSGELFYIHHSETIQYDFYLSEDDKTYIKYDSADYERHKYGFHFKYGGLLHIGEHFGFNPYIGLGFRMRDNSFSNVINPLADFGYDDDEYDFFEDYREEEGINFNVNFSLGIKVFVRF